MKNPNWMTLLILSIPAVVLLITNLQEGGVITVTCAQLAIALVLAIKKYLEESKVEPSAVIARSIDTSQPLSKWERVWLY